MLKMELITEQLVFVVKTCYKTINFLVVKETFCRRCPEKNPPANRGT